MAGVHVGFAYLREYGTQITNMSTIVLDVTW